MIATGGIIMYTGALFYFVVLAVTLLRRPVDQPEPSAQELFAASLSPASNAPAIFESWRLWIAVAIAMILIAYGPYFLTYTANFVSPGFRGIW